MLAALLLAGCGAESNAGARSDRLVDFSKRPALVNSLEHDPRTGEYLLTTNRGFFRVDPDVRTVTRVRGTVAAGGKRAAIGTFLELNLDDDGLLVGSGHPDDRRLPQYLGYLRSQDGGKTWQVISRLGDADLHKIVFKHDRLYAWDAVIGAVLISRDGVALSDATILHSRDGGASWDERFRP